MIDDLIERLNLTLVENIGHGHRCKSVFRVKDKLNQSLILKVSGTGESLREISTNIQGYEKMVSLGLGFFIPQIMSSQLSDTNGYILMEDCGMDLADQISLGCADKDISTHITANLLRVYQKSWGEGPDANQHMEFEAATVKNLYRDFAKTDYSLPQSQVENILGKLLRSLRTRIYCFASWDFMPHNIYAAQGGLKFGDPPAMVTGMPIFDLAILGATLQDVFQFPGADHFHEFALGPVAATLSVSRRNAQAIYEFGRLVQALLHLREYYSHQGIRDSFNQRIQQHLQKLLFFGE